MNRITYVTIYVLQVMCSALRLREEIDVGYVLFEDLQEKCKFVYSRREEIIDRLREFRSMQLRLVYAVMGLEEAENDIAGDVEFARIALGLGGLVKETIPTTVEVCTEPVIGLDDIGTEDPQSYVTPAHTLAVGPPGCRVTVSPGRQPDLGVNSHVQVVGMNLVVDVVEVQLEQPNVTDTIVEHANVSKDTETSEEQGKMSVPNVEHEGIFVETNDTARLLTPTTCSLASEVVEQRIEETSTQQKMKKDPSFDDVLGRTTHKSDGRQVLVIRAQNVE